MNERLLIQVFGFPSGVGGGGSCTTNAPAVLVENGLLSALKGKGRAVAYEDLSRRYPSLSRPAGHSRNIGVKHLFRVRNSLRCAYVEASRAHQNNSVPVFIGGDHTLAAATICASLGKYGNSLKVIYVDQHGDVHDHLTSPSMNAHGMPLALAMGYGHERLTAAGGIAPRERVLQASQLLHLGADKNSLEDAEWEYFRRHGISHIPLAHTNRDGFEKLCEQTAHFAKDSPVHVSFDIDATDAPGTGYPGKHGYTREQAVLLMHAIQNAGTVASVDMVEYCPDKDEPDVDGVSYTTINHIREILSVLLA